MFPLDSSLLNHGFQGYKLRLALTETRPVSAHPLREPCGLEAPRAVAQASTRFSLLQSRGTFNHLCPDAFLSNHLYYFAPAGRLVLVKVQEAGREEAPAVLETPLLELACPFSSSAPTTSTTDLLLPECPSLAFAAPDLAVASDGRGGLHLVEIAADRASARAVFSFAHGAIDPAGYVVLSAVRGPQSREVRCLVYCAAEPLEPDSTQKVQYVVRLLSILPSSSSDYAVSVLATVRGADYPRVGFVEDDGRAFALGGFDFSSDSQPPPAPRTRPAPRYSWCQTGEDVTVSVTLPHGTPKSQVRCALTATGARVSVDGDDVAVFEGTLYDGIRCQESTWTLEDGGPSLGVTLHLEKQHAPLRWPQLLAKEDGVLETRDPSELAAAVERLEKYTGERPPGGDRAEGKLTSLQGTEECDELGETFVMTRFDERGMLAQRTHTSQEWLCASAAAGFLSKKRHRRVQVALKMDVDALVYEVRAGLEAAHVGTFPAFGYVQASKRQRKYLAFLDTLQAALVLESSRHVYLYRQPEPPGSSSADQYLYDLGSTDEVLGVCQLSHRLVAVLTEARLFLLRLPF